MGTEGPALASGIQDAPYPLKRGMRLRLREGGGRGGQGSRSLGPQHCRSEVRGIFSGIFTGSEHQIITGQLAEQNGLAGHTPGERMKPVDDEQ